MFERPSVVHFFVKRNAVPTCVVSAVCNNCNLRSLQYAGWTTFGWTIFKCLRTSSPAVAAAATNFLGDFVGDPGGCSIVRKWILDGKGRNLCCEHVGCDTAAKYLGFQFGLGFQRGVEGGTFGQLVDFCMGLLNS